MWSNCLKMCLSLCQKGSIYNTRRVLVSSLIPSMGCRVVRLYFLFIYTVWPQIDQYKLNYNIILQNESGCFCLHITLAALRGPFSVGVFVHHILDSLTKLVYFVPFSRFKALESMMEETLNQSVSIRDDKIHALESRFVCLLIFLSGNKSWISLRR